MSRAYKVPVSTWHCNNYASIVSRCIYAVCSTHNHGVVFLHHGTTQTFSNRQMIDRVTENWSQYFNSP